MPIWTEDDIAAMTSEDQLAETVLWYASFGDNDICAVMEGYSFNAIFNDASKILNLGIDVSSSAPELQFGEDILPLLMKTDQFKVRGTRYDIVDINPDGAGWMVVQTKKA